MKLKEFFLIIRAIIAARYVQEYLWQRDKGEVFNPPAISDLLNKRLRKIYAVNPESPHATVEVRKRLLQVAALAICIMVRLPKKFNE